MTRLLHSLDTLEIGFVTKAIVEAAEQTASFALGVLVAKSLFKIGSGFLKHRVDLLGSKLVVFGLLEVLVLLVDCHSLSIDNSSEVEVSLCIVGSKFNSLRDIFASLVIVLLALIQNTHNIVKFGILGRNCDCLLQQSLSLIILLVVNLVVDDDCQIL